MSDKFDININLGTAYIKVPFNPEFNTRIKAMGGKWDTITNRWTVNARSIDAARIAMMDVYGESDESICDYVTVVLTFNESDYALCEPYMLFGRILASARGRDSGARVGDLVAFVKGKPDSGGSAKNWHTEIPAGSVVELYEIPREFAMRCISELPNGIKATIKENSKTDTESLLAEKQRLLARIAEINKLLGE